MGNSQTIRGVIMKKDIQALTDRQLEEEIKKISAKSNRISLRIVALQAYLFDLKYEKREREKREEIPF